MTNANLATRAQKAAPGPGNPHVVLVHCTDRGDREKMGQSAANDTFYELSARRAEAQEAEDA